VSDASDASDDAEPLLDATELVGLLADDGRRAVVAALVLGADDAASVRNATGLEVRAAARAVNRLVDAGLVERAGDGHLTLLGQAFVLAARDAARRAAARDASDEHHDAPSEHAKVLRRFVRNGRIVQIPVHRKSRLVVLDWLAQHFDPGQRYSERMVNLIIGRIHPDTAALRRYLVDEGFLDREQGEYWRSGGHVPT
jgi:hypothetical protein